MQFSVSDIYLFGFLAVVFSVRPFFLLVVLRDSAVVSLSWPRLCGSAAVSLTWLWDLTGFVHGTVAVSLTSFWDLSGFAVLHGGSISESWSSQAMLDWVRAKCGTNFDRFLYMRPGSSILAPQHAIGSIAWFQQHLSWLEQAVSEKQQ